jgi:radical SAM family uncharacterized protein/radical SAM-linked protein
MQPNESEFEGLLALVEKPGRYLGNEKGAVRKDPRNVSVRFALAFPEVYEIAQSHPGLQILYDLLNRRTDVYAERVYAPWFDMEALLRKRRLPLVSLETFTPLHDFDIVGFSLQYELTYTNLLAMLDLGGVPLLAADRRTEHPLVIAGGPCAFNPEPIADFLDAVLIGDGEEAIHDICDLAARRREMTRLELLRAMADIKGIYVPAFYRPRHGADGRLVAIDPVEPDQPAEVGKRILKDLDSVPIAETFVVPNLRVVHGRPSLEVMRGCVKGCRFCQAGYIYRPLRERDPQRVLENARAAVAATGTQELSLLSLSTGDYSCVNPVITELMNLYAPERVAVSLPSTRVDALAPSLLEQIKRVRKTGFTLAPEAGTQRMRDIIQKEYGEDELIEAARQIFSLGWRSLKLYFMIGLPGETEADVRGIAELAARVAREGGRGVEVTASISTFVPKPHTPFQWSGQIDVEETEARQRLLRDELARRRVRFKWHDARTSYLEGVVSRGGRELGPVIRRAYELGCRFDGWTEHCHFDLWEQAMRETGLDGAGQLRRRLLDEPLPWDHIDSGVTKKFLQQDLARAVEGRLTPDCSIARCTYCGACDFKEIRNITYHLRGAKGSEHRGSVVDHWASGIVDTDGAPGGWEPRGWHKLHTEGFAAAAADAPGNGAEPMSEGAALPRGARAAAPDSPGLGNAEEWLSASSEALSSAPPPSVAPVMRVRIHYAKTGRSRFISHLEMIEVLAGAIRRAGIPVAFSGGFHPQPRMRFSPGLPVGAESDCEVVDIDLAARRDPAELATALGCELPEGLIVTGASEVSLRCASPDQTLSGYCYRIDLGRLAVDSTAIDAAVESFSRATTLPVRRHTKRGPREVDALPFISRLERSGDTHLEIDVRFSERGSVKPTDVLAALFSLDPIEARALPMRKVRVFLRPDAEVSAG